MDIILSDTGAGSIYNHSTFDFRLLISVRQPLLESYALFFISLKAAITETGSLAPVAFL